MDVRIFTIQETMRIDLYWKRMSFKLLKYLPGFFLHCAMPIKHTVIFHSFNAVKLQRKRLDQSRSDIERFLKNISC